MKLLTVLLCLSAGLVAGDDFNPNTVRFLIVGDWGGIPVEPYQSPFQMAVARQMGKTGEMYQTQFQLALGDNFYEEGVTDVDDKRFQETFEAAFTAQSLQTRWYVVAGNHDHYGNATAEVAYTKRSNRWFFPDLFYTFTVPVPSSKGMAAASKVKFFSPKDKFASTKVMSSSSTIDFVMVDTIVLCGDSGHDSLGEQPHLTLKQSFNAGPWWTWLEDQLKASTANYLIVAGHYPVYSIAEHGPTNCLVKDLLPLLFKYNVTAYFSGHDHSLQHLQSTQGKQTMDYFVIGAGDVVSPSQKHKDAVPEGSLKFHWATVSGLGGFSYVETDETQMQFTFIDAVGHHLYQKTLLPRY